MLTHIKNQCLMIFTIHIKKMMIDLFLIYITKKRKAYQCISFNAGLYIFNSPFNSSNFLITEAKIKKKKSFFHNWQFLKSATNYRITRQYLSAEKLSLCLNCTFLSFCDNVMRANDFLPVQVVYQSIRSTTVNVESRQLITAE